MNIEFDKEYLHDLYFKGKTSVDCHSKQNSHGCGNAIIYNDKGQQSAMGWLLTFVIIVV